jgi:hypothetical protein
MSQERESIKEISINLNCYLIRIRKKHEKSQYLKIKQGFSNKNFNEIINEFIKYLDTRTYQNENRDRILYIDKSIANKKTYYSGVIKKGYNGQESYIDEIKASKANTINTIKANQFNSSPFYFILSQPDAESDYILFIAQSYKQYGFKDLFEEAFRKFYKEKYGTNFLCEFTTLTIASLFDNYIREGSIRKLRFRKHKLTQNTENLLSEEDGEKPEDFIMELSIIAKKKGFMGLKRNIKSTSGSFLETVKVDDFEYDEVLADVSFAGRKRVLNISRPEEFSASFDVTEKACINAVTRHPDFGALNDEALKILQEEIMPNIG